MHDHLAQMKRDFLNDASEALEKITQILAGLGPSQQATRAEIDRLFRTAHSLKGTAGMFELHEVSTVAESIENVLELVRSDNVNLEGEVAELLLEAFDEVSVLFAKARGQDVDSHANAVVSKIESFIDSLSATGSGAAYRSDKAEDITCDTILTYLGKHERQLLRTRIAAGDSIFYIDLSSCGSPGLHREDVVLRRLQANGEIISILPGSAKGRGASSGICLVYALRGKNKDLEEITRDSGARIRQLKDHIKSGWAQSLNGHDHREVVAKKAGPDSGAEASEASELTVKVDIGVLDSVMNTITELYSVRVGLMGIADRLPRTKETRRLRDDLLKLSLLINKRVSALEGAVSNVRLVPVSTLFTRYRGEIRRLARTLGKQVRLVFEGEATLVDRALLERLYDPLLHLIRNAVGHGIEPPDVRVAKAKPAEGTVLLRASQESNHIRIDVEDDGRGIDLARIRAAAEHVGIEPGDDLSPTALLFRPGFSTRGDVDSVSGRGVGLDAVRTEVAAMKGTVSVETDLPAGTRFSIYVPLTIALSRGVLLQEEGIQVVIPLGSVDEILALTSDCVENIRHTGLIEHGGADLPVAVLQDRLGLAGRGDPRFAVVVRVGDRRHAIATRRVCGEADVISRPLPAAMRGPDFITGATELRSGEAAIVIQPEQIERGQDPKRGLSMVCRERLPAAAAAALEDWKQGKLLRLLVYQIDSGLYATPLCILKEVVQSRSITRVPAIGGVWEGLFFVKGMCHGLMRLGSSGPRPDAGTPRIVIFMFPDRCGIASSEIVGSYVVPFGKIDMAGSQNDGPIERLGVFRWRGKDVTVLDAGGAMGRLLKGGDSKAAKARGETSGTEALMRTSSPDDT